MVNDPSFEHGGMVVDSAPVSDRFCQQKRFRFYADRATV